LLLFTFLDFREGMRESSLATTRLATVEGYLKNSGPDWLYSTLAFNLVLAPRTAASDSALSRAVRGAPGVSPGAACSAGGATLVGFSCFGCPGCYMPLAGSWYRS